MTIPEIKLSQQEICDAVGTYLIARGITVPVESVDKNYSGSGAFRVTLQDPTSTDASPEAPPQAAPKVEE